MFFFFNEGEAQKEVTALLVGVAEKPPIISTGVTFEKGCLESGVHTSIKFLKLLKLDELT